MLPFILFLSIYLSYIVKYQETCIIHTISNYFNNNNNDNNYKIKHKTKIWMYAIFSDHKDTR
jgi:hypothetical protein